MRRPPKDGAWAISAITADFEHRSWAQKSFGRPNAGDLCDDRRDARPRASARNASNRVGCAGIARTAGGWWLGAESNRRPQHYECRALTV